MTGRMKAGRLARGEPPDIDDEQRTLWQRLLPALKVLEDDVELGPLWRRVRPDLERALDRAAMPETRRLRAAG